MALFIYVYEDRITILHMQRLDKI